MTNDEGHGDAREVPIMTLRNTRETEKADSTFRIRGSFVIRHSSFVIKRGFTLIELLTVISILSILMALALVGINAARDRGDEMAVSTDIQFLSSAIQQFSEEMGDFPPSGLGDIDRKLSGNGINEGNESLFGFLLSRKRGGPYAELEEDRWVNTDLDHLSGAQKKIIKKEINWVRGNDALLEYVDIWGNPYVYIHNSDYGTKFSYQSTEGLLFEVEAQKNPATGTYYAPTTFQLWSLGSDGENQNGEGDDIVSWN